MTARAARIVTEVLTPPVLVVGLLVLVGALSAGSAAAGAGWGLLAALFTAVLPYGAVLLGVRSGRFTDHHLTDRAERLKPFGLTLVSAVAGMALLVGLGAPRPLVALTLAELVGLLVTAVITRWWKVSVHTAVAAGTATVLVAVLGAGWWPCWAAVAAVGWSRVVLRRHTLAQVLVGAPLGAVTVGAVFLSLA